MRPVKTAIVVLLLCAWPFGAGAAEADGASGQVQLKWLGNAGWEIRVNDKIILIDPFLTRRAAKPDAEWITDEAAVLKTITRADYVFVGHSHADHVADVPYIAKRFGAKVIGSRTSVNLALTAGVDKSQVIVATDGERLDFGAFSVQVIESRHAVLARHTGRPKQQEMLEPITGPIRGKNFLEGRCLLYYFAFGKHRVLHQSTANFIVEKLDGLHPDVALLAAGHNYDLKGALKALGPKTVIVQHYDEWRAPFSSGITPSSTRRAQRFAREVTAADGRIKVIIPEFLSTHTLQ